LHHHHHLPFRRLVVAHVPHHHCTLQRRYLPTPAYTPQLPPYLSGFLPILVVGFYHVCTLPWLPCVYLCSYTVPFYILPLPAHTRGSFHALPLPRTDFRTFLVAYSVTLVPTKRPVPATLLPTPACLAHGPGWPFSASHGLPLPDGGRMTIHTCCPQPYRLARTRGTVPTSLLSGGMDITRTLPFRGSLPVTVTTLLYGRCDLRALPAPRTLAATHHTVRTFISPRPPRCTRPYTLPFPFHHIFILPPHLLWWTLPYPRYPVCVCRGFVPPTPCPGRLYSFYRHLGHSLNLCRITHHTCHHPCCPVFPEHTTTGFTTAHLRGGKPLPAATTTLGIAWVSRLHHTPRLATATHCPQFPPVWSPPDATHTAGLPRTCACTVHTHLTFLPCHLPTTFC